MRVYRESEALAVVRGLTRERLRAWVARGLVNPRAAEDEYLFDELDLARFELLVTIREDLGLREEDLPLVVALLDRIYGLRRQLRRLLEAIGELPQEQRQRILERLARD